MPRLGKKTRLNLTIDPDIHREAREVFGAMDLNMSSFVEMQLAQFLQMVRPLLPMMEGIQNGNQSPSEIKAAMRVFMAQSQAMMGGKISEFGTLTSEMAELIREEVNTDKK